MAGETLSWCLRGGGVVDVVVVVMGVSGCGKTTVGRLLAARLGWRFMEGDAFHPDENVDKMSSGIPLVDADRWPWLERIRVAIDSCSRDGDHVVLACSALRAGYRDVLTVGRDDIRFVYLKGSEQTIRERMNARRDHYMKPEMLDSQLTSLEEPVDALMVDIDPPPADIVSHILRALERETCRGS